MNPRYMSPRVAKPLRERHHRRIPLVDLDQYLALDGCQAVERPFDHNAVQLAIDRVRERTLLVRLQRINRNHHFRMPIAMQLLLLRYCSANVTGNFFIPWLPSEKFVELRISGVPTRSQFTKTSRRA